MRPLFENSNWKVSENLDKEGDFLEYEYFYSKEKCHKIKLESNRVKHYEGYILINRDIRNIEVWLKLLIEYLHKIYGEKIPKIPTIRTKGKEDLHDVIKSLFISSITTYGKLFTQADGRNVKLENNIFKGHTELLDFHNELMKHRHNFAAHSGKIKIEGANVYLLIDSVRNRGIKPLIIREIFQPDCPSFEDIIKFQDVISYLKLKIDEKLAKIYDNIYSNIIKKGEEFWYSYIDFET